MEVRKKKGMKIKSFLFFSFVMEKIIVMEDRKGDPIQTKL